MSTCVDICRHLSTLVDIRPPERQFPHKRPVSTFVDNCPLLSTFVDFPRCAGNTSSDSILQSFCPLLSTFVHFCPLLSTFVHFCPLLSTLVHFGPLLSTLVQISASPNMGTPARACHGTAFGTHVTPFRSCMSCDTCTWMLIHDWSRCDSHAPVRKSKPSLARMPTGNFIWVGILQENDKTYIDCLMGLRIRICCFSVFKI